MKIKKLTIKNFRNIEKIELVPDNTTNIFLGENAEGKTSLLEAMWLFSGAKSFRAARDCETVMFGKEKAVLTCDFLSGGTEKTAEIEIADRRRAKLFGKNLQRPSLLSEYFHAVVFSPQDLSIIDGDPAVRRRFLDLAIGSLSAKYIDALKKYNRAIIQRNNLLKKARTENDAIFLLEPFEEEAAASGETIINLRYRYVDKLNIEAPQIYSGISEEKEKLTVSYLSKSQRNITKEELFEKFKAHRNADIAAGTTLIGPKRDDLFIEVNGKSTKLYGSQGQKRSAALCLKLAEAEILKQTSGEEPIALLDDVLSELDTSRQRYILNKFKDKQVFITACDPANTMDLKSGLIVKIKDGKICSYN